MKSKSLALPFYGLALEICSIQVSRLQDLKTEVARFVAYFFLAAIFYFAALHLVASARPAEAKRALLIIVFFALLFRLTLLPLAPSLSDDLYRYQWDGYVQLHGFNPYVTKPADVADAKSKPGFVERAAGQPYPTIYPPLAQLLFRFNAKLTTSPIYFKILLVIFDVGIIGVLVGLLGTLNRNSLFVAAYAWNPLSIIEFSASGHIDALSVFFLLTAILAIIRNHPRLSICFLALATAAKLWPALLLPLFLKDKKIQSLALFAAILLILALPYLDAGPHIFDGLRAYAGEWNFNDSGFAVLKLIFPSTGIAKFAAGALLIALLFFFWMKQRPVLESCLWMIAALLFLSPTVYPWYLTWILPFLCFIPNVALLMWSITVVLSYHVLVGYQILGTWHDSLFFKTLEFAPVIFVLLLTRAKLFASGFEASAFREAASLHEAESRGNQG